MDIVRDSQSGEGLVLNVFRQSGRGDVTPSETVSEDARCTKCPPGGCLELPLSHEHQQLEKQLQECFEYDELLLGDAKPEPKPKPKPKPKPEPIPKPSEPQYEKVECKPYTGMFNDGCRRVDMVLVMLEYDNLIVQEIKAQYLVNINSIGLEIEVHRGVMANHTKLLFVKIHAPDRVLADYMESFDTMKLFKNKNFEYVNTNTLFHRIFKYRYEMEWIEFVQENYLPSLKLSNHDRSYIVYMLLRYMSFGIYKNYVGLERLLGKNIILDAYALHDGPYFFPNNQDFTLVNARQILFYNWLGVQNILKLQPLHLIHEYLGPMVAFYFAFYELYNLALLPLAIVGILKSIPMVSDGSELCITKFTCDLLGRGSTDIRENRNCPRCLDFFACPFIWETDECARRTMIGSWENDYLFYFSLFVCVWALIFLALWLRLEQYLIWIWGLCHPARHCIIRPQHKIGHVVRSQRTGVLLESVSIISKLWRTVVAGLILTLCILSIFVVVGALLYAKYQVIRDTSRVERKKSPTELPTKYTLSDYYVTWYRALTICVLVTLVVLMCLEQIFKIVSLCFTNLENHGTIASYQHSLIMKLFVFKALCTLVPVMFFAWLKGTFYRYPHLDWFPKLTIELFKKNITIELNFLRHFIHLNCNVGTCFDEVILSFGITILIKVILMRVWRLFWIIRTDYLLSRETLLTVPVWEREYRLSPVTEQTMMDKFCDLALQFTLMTWFVPALPFAPALALFFNIWHLRYDARHILLGSRRPLLFRSVGIGPWNGVLAFIAYATGFALAVFILLQTQIVYRYSTKNTFYSNGTCPNFMETCTYFHVDLSVSTGWKTDPLIMEEMDKMGYKNFLDQDLNTCHLFGKKGSWEVKSPDPQPPFPDFRPFICYGGDFQVCRGERMQNIYFYNLLVILFFHCLVLVTTLLLKYYMPPVSKFVKERTQLESHIMQAYRYQFSDLYTCARPPDTVTAK